MLTLEIQDIRDLNKRNTSLLSLKKKGLRADKDNKSDIEEAVLTSKNNHHVILICCGCLSIVTVYHAADVACSKNRISQFHSN